MARASYSPYRSASGCWRTGNTEAMVGDFTFFEQPISTNVLFRLRIHRVTFLRGDFVVKKFFSLLCFAMSALSLSVAHGQFSLQALSSFGGGDGWLAPAEFPVTPGADLIRGIAYHSPSNRLIVVDRTGGTTVRLLSGDTGVQVGTLDTTGVAGGQFAANMVGVADDGHVYMGNLSVSTSQNFKVYRWDSSEVFNPTSAPTIAFDGASGRNRTGDSFAVTGSGANTRIVAAGGSVAGDTAFAFASLTTADGLTFTSANPGVTAPVGSFRLGIDFDDAGNVLGRQTGSTTGHLGSLSGGAASTFSLVNPSEAALAFYAPLNLLATMQVTGTPGINTVRLYNASNLSSLVLLDTKNLALSTNSNGNGVGAVSFGLGPDGGLRLYALNTNNGIQAFSVVPEPSAGLLALVAGLGLAVRRRRA